MFFAKKNLGTTDGRAKQVREDAIVLMKKNNPKADTNDTNYVFLSFVIEYLPVGMVGLLIAIIFLASMGSTASGLNSLASTTFIDFYKRFSKKESNEKRDLYISRITTVIWGVFCLVVALYAGKLGNLIEAVNILGSLFYGTILGIFVVAFYVKHVEGTAVFYAAIIAEILVVLAWYFDLSAFLWLNVVGCMLVVLFSLLINPYTKRKTV